MEEGIPGRCSGTLRTREDPAEPVLRAPKLPTRSGSESGPLGAQGAGDVFGADTRDPALPRSLLACGAPERGDRKLRGEGGVGSWVQETLSRTQRARCLCGRAWKDVMPRTLALVCYFSVSRTPDNQMRRRNLCGRICLKRVTGEISNGLSLS